MEILFFWYNKIPKPTTFWIYPQPPTPSPVNINRISTTLPFNPVDATPRSQVDRERQTPLSEEVTLPEGDVGGGWCHPFRITSEIIPKIFGIISIQNGELDLYGKLMIHVYHVW